MTSHIPDPTSADGPRYPNASRGWRRKQTVSAPFKVGLDSAPQPDSPAERFAHQRRRNWARLLKKIYQVDPL